MMKSTGTSSVEASMVSVLKPFSKSMTPGLAQAMSRLRINKDFQRRLDELADKNTEGELSLPEQQEYDHHLAALSFVTIMQSKARQKLRTHKTKK